MKTLKTNWLIKHALTVFSCVLIIVLGIAFISRAVPVTTTIGENIATNDLSVAGNVTSGNWQGTAIGAQYGGTGADWSAVAQGNIPYFSGTGILSNLAPGTAGQFLKSQGTGADPAWANVTRSATFVVAASDSSALSKQQADYVCDGVDDQVEIQAAIDALGTSGGTIHFTRGLYTVSAPIYYKDKTVFEGEGLGNTKITLANNSNCNMFERTLATNAQNFFNEWRGLYLYGNKSNNINSSGIYATDYIHDVIIDSCFIESFSDYNLYFKNIWNISITHNILEHAGKAAINLAGGRDGRITDNKFLYNYRGIISTTASILISNNFFWHTVSDSTHEEEIRIDWSSGIRILGNYFDSSGASITPYTIQIRSTTGLYIISENSFTGGNMANYGIYDQSNNTFGPSIITDNVFSSYLIIPIFVNRTIMDTVIKNNIGYITENSGTATITAAQTSVIVTHGLATTPTRVQLTPTTDTAGKRYWISAKGAATFTITIDSTHTSDISFDWRAVVGEGN